jgi:hypothetical protein
MGGSVISRTRSYGRDEDRRAPQDEDARVPEGLSAGEVGKEIGEHATHRGPTHERRDELISIGEAVPLSIVALVAA